MSDSPKDTPTTTPPDTRSTSWEDAPGFREIFLAHFPPEAADAFREAGRHLYDSALCASFHEPEPFVGARVRALAEDLRLVARVFKSLARAPSEASLSEAEEQLARRCSEWSVELAAVLLGIEGALEDGEDS